ncbi:MAG: proton-conducting transporter membrane subunit, partial [Candidatus Rokuibacteriota bacterium]
MEYLTVLPLAIALLAPAAAGAGLYRPAWTPWIAVSAAGLTFAATAAAWGLGAPAIDREWAPTVDLRLQFALDGLAALFALVASGIGLVVLLYASRYVPRHLEHQDRPPRENVRFHGFMLLFLAAMIGLAIAQDLILLFVFFELTAITSYFLIGYDRTQVEAREAALMALLVTGIASILFLVGALQLHAQHGTFAIGELLRRAPEAGATLSVPVALIAVAAFAKSAQVPFHFWLPVAMAA